MANLFLEPRAAHAEAYRLSGMCRSGQGTLVALAVASFWRLGTARSSPQIDA